MLIIVSFQRVLKFLVLITLLTAISFQIKINKNNIESSTEENLLGVILDDQVNFKSYMNNPCTVGP